MLILLVNEVDCKNESVKWIKMHKIFGKWGEMHKLIGKWGNLFDITCNQGKY